MTTVALAFIHVLTLSVSAFLFGKYSGRDVETKYYLSVSAQLVLVLLLVGWAIAELSVFINFGNMLRALGAFVMVAVSGYMVLLIRDMIYFFCRPGSERSAFSAGVEIVVAAIIAINTVPFIEESIVQGVLRLVVFVLAFGVLSYLFEGVRKAIRQRVSERQNEIWVTRSWQIVAVIFMLVALLIVTGTMRPALGVLEESVGAGAAGVLRYLGLLLFGANALFYDKYFW
tara:strand:+ start:365 stop:1051 length:687 start_codon:yes stop_codon:yes gene_type:complete